MDKNVDEYIEKQESPQREICKKLRNIIFKTFPDIKDKEEMKWSVQQLLILYTNIFNCSQILHG